MWKKALALGMVLMALGVVVGGITEEGRAFAVAGYYLSDNPNWDRNAELAWDLLGTWTSGFYGTVAGLAFGTLAGFGVGLAIGA